MIGRDPLGKYSQLLNFFERQSPNSDQYASIFSVVDVEKPVHDLPVSNNRRLLARIVGI